MQPVRDDASQFGVHLGRRRAGCVAAEWTRRAYHVDVINKTLETASLKPASTDLVLAAHCLEHMQDAPGMLKTMYDLLKPGRPLVIIVPDDTDATNPDHLWFFRPEDLVGVLEAAGFHGLRIRVAKRVEHENFIYCTAWK